VEALNQDTTFCAASPPSSRVRSPRKTAGACAANALRIFGGQANCTGGSRSGLQTAALDLSPRQSPRHFARIAGKCQSGSDTLPRGEVSDRPALGYLRRRCLSLSDFSKAFISALFSSSVRSLTFSPNCFVAKGMAEYEANPDSFVPLDEL